MQWLLMPVAIAAGSLMVVQAACNRSLEVALDRPVTVGVLSLAIGLAALLMGGLVSGQLQLPAGRVAQVPWWAWLGGLCGATALLSQPLAAPKLGAALYIGLFVTASCVVSVLADHFSWLGFPEHAAGVGRIIGCALMVIGITLISLF